MTRTKTHKTDSINSNNNNNNNNKNACTHLIHEQELLPVHLRFQRDPMEQGAGTNGFDNVLTVRLGTFKRGLVGGQDDLVERGVHDGAAQFSQFGNKLQEGLAHHLVHHAVQEWIIQHRAGAAQPAIQLLQQHVGMGVV